MKKTEKSTPKNKQAQKQNRLQHIVYALITVVITVHAFVLYSLYFVEGESLMQATGTASFAQAIRSQGGVYMFASYLPVWAVILVETVCAFVLAVAVGSPLAFWLASRKFDPRRNHPMIFESAINEPVGRLLLLSLLQRLLLHRLPAPLVPPGVL